MNRFTIVLAALLVAPLVACADRAAAPAERPVYSDADCERLQSGEAGGSAAERAALAALPALTSAQAVRLRASSGADVLWWLRRQGAVNLSTLPTAYHEANHALDVALAACHGGRAVYVFDGKTYVTELVRGSTAPYVVAAAAVPEAIKAGAAVRYQTYLVQTPRVPANDFTTLLDELNAYVGGATIEVELAGTPLYTRFRADGNAALDGNIGGTADMMLYILSYLKVVRSNYPDSYARIAASPLLLAHLQRLWTAAEAMLKAAAPHGSERGGLYVYPIAALVAVRSGPFSEELDRLKIRHAD